MQAPRAFVGWRPMGVRGGRGRGPVARWPAPCPSRPGPPSTRRAAAPPAQCTQHSALRRVCDARPSTLDRVRLTDR